MSERNKNKINLIDINDGKFFEEDDSYFAKTTKTTNNGGFLQKLIVASVLLSFLLIALVVFVPLDKIDASFLVKKLNGQVSQDNGKNTGFELFKTRENILFLGVDSNGRDSDPFKDTRTDTIMLVSIDKATKSVNVISIPRDSKVYISGHGNDKINAAHAVGGIDLTLKTIQEMFGIKVDHYVLINYDGLKEIISVLGTIPVNVEKKLRYKDYAGKLFVNLDPGEQELNADQVEQFVRFRHDAIGDIGRVERQRMLMKGIIKKIQSPESIAKLPEIISVTSKYIKTDMNVFDITRYAGIAKSVNTDNVVVATLPGHPSQNSYVSYWILEPDRVQTIIDRLVYRQEPPVDKENNLKVSLLYNENFAKNLETVKETLKENNIDVVCENLTTKSTPEVIAHTDNVNFERYQNLKTIIPQLKTAHMTIFYEWYLCGESDATLVLSETK